MRLLPAQRGLKLACALLVFVFHGCGNEQTATPEDQIREGWKRYRLSEFSEALGIFESVEASQPRGSEAYLQSLYGQASCWNHRRDGRDIAKAVALYQAVIDQATHDPLAAWCALDIVRTQHLAPADQPIDYPTLIRDYATVYARYSQTPAGEEAFLHRSNLSVHLADAEKTRTLLAEIQEFVASHPATPFLPQFYDMMAECCHKLNEEDRHLEYLVKAVEARPVDPASPLDDRSTAYWKIAYAAEFDAGNFPLACEYYQRLINEYPKDIRIFGARKALERMDAIKAALREGRPLA
ncbi:MAG TPA: tetratricopeptide repeat protein, partial [Terrimicrobiaceae bacterium]